PSPSGSSTGQPSPGGVVLGAATSGQRSTESTMLSPSLSGSGQPSSSSNPSLSSGSAGQRSSLSTTPSPSVSVGPAAGFLGAAPKVRTRPRVSSNSDVTPSPALEGGTSRRASNRTPLSSPASHLPPAPAWPTRSVSLPN